MKNQFNLIKSCKLAAPLALALSIFASPSLQAGATIPGITGPTFTLNTNDDFLTTPDGGSVYVWGYGVGNNSAMQYPGPTLIVNQGDTVTINLTNHLPQYTSIVFPGQEGVTSSCAIAAQCRNGLLAKEVRPNGKVTYSFVAGKPGTYLYHSGTRPDLQSEMGLVGAMIVRPTGYTGVGANNRAYNHAGSRYDHEYMSLLTEMDVRIHDEVQNGAYNSVDTRDYKPVWWFINGRNSVDTLSADNDALLPNQPYGAAVRTRPGEKVLLRLIGAGRDPHPYHTHGNNFTLLAKDARMFESNPGVSGPNRTTSGFTNETFPGDTYDLLFTWSGAGLGWDMYGYTHATQPTYCGANNNALAAYPADKRSQLATDRCKPLPVVLPGLQELTFGPFYSGSPYLGGEGQLPPGEGGFNANNGYFFMWHSHSERELVNFDIFPGGMMTFLIVEPPGTPIP
ncbi:MAG: multicopper oxidase domain-containing protein [Methyloglobulus sp.]|nr:multicopper oxidase domain-containing protein [Methyloglobulus sp.]